MLHLTSSLTVPCMYAEHPDQFLPTHFLMCFHPSYPPCPYDSLSQIHLTFDFVLRPNYAALEMSIGSWWDQSGYTTESQGSLSLWISVASNSAVTQIRVSDSCTQYSRTFYCMVSFFDICFFMVRLNPQKQLLCLLLHSECPTSLPTGSQSSIKLGWKGE